MRKIIILLSIFFLINLIFFTVTAAQETQRGDQNQDQDQDRIRERELDQVQEEDQDRGDLIIAPRGQQLRARTVNELRVMIQEKQVEMDQEIQSFKVKQQRVYQNQNEVRLAVHSLLAMEDLTGGIGQEVSQIAREFDNSVQATIRAEEKIETRNRVLRFFIGGDKKSAEEIEGEVNRNRDRVQQLKQLREQSDCQEEVKAMFQEQIRKIEQEQNRLEQLAQGEKQYKGLFGRLLNWLRR